MTSRPRAWQPRRPRPPPIEEGDPQDPDHVPGGDHWTTPSTTSQPNPTPETWNDEGWEAFAWDATAWAVDPWSQSGTDPWGGSGSSRDGWMTDAQLRDFNVARVDRTTAINNGRWAGSYDLASDWPDRAWRSDPKPSEKLVVPEFDGEGVNDTELGRSARSYVRRVQVWLRCTKMPPEQRALALYTALTGKAWVYAEELDVDLLAMDTGVSYFLEWIQTRFMEVELTKISGIMNELFRKCRRRTDQSVRDFNVEFERLVLRFHEVRCELPPLIKGWLYLDKLRLSEAEELALLSSVNNTYDVRRLQQAALVQDRSLRRPSSNHAEPEKKPWGKRWTGRQSVHLTYHDETSEEEDEGGEEGEGELLDEETACQQHTAYMAYQGAKAKYREALRGRGADVEELKKRSDERLKLAKLRSYCSACKRKGHWHRDPECPMRGQSSRTVRHDDKFEGGKNMQSAQMCQVVYLTEVSGVTGRGRQSFNLEDHVSTGGAAETFVPKAEIGEPSDMCVDEPNEIVESFVLETSKTPRITPGWGGIAFHASSTTGTPRRRTSGRGLVS